MAGGPALANGAAGCPSCAVFSTRPLLRASAFGHCTLPLCSVDSIRQRSDTGTGLTMKGKVKSVFFPEVPGQIISVLLEMDRSASVELTRANVETYPRSGEAVQ